MIRRLRNRFIRIATLSVAAVMLLLTVILNTANFISTDGDLRDTLTLIQENEGTIPLSAHTGSAAPSSDTDTSAATDPTGDTSGAAPGDAQPPQDPGTPPSDAPQSARPNDRPRGPFTAETPYSTRYFVLRYGDDGELTMADLSKIASVSQEDTGEYLAAAVKHGPGYGYYGSYRFLVVHNGQGRNMAIFLDCYQAQRSMKTVLLWSLAADGACILLVLGLVVLLSRRAIDPVVRSVQRQKQFITDASHELKTPITVIATSLKVLEMEVGKQKWIDKALGQTEKLTSLVSSLVTLSRMDEEDSPLKPEPFPISEAVEETAESFRDLAQSKGHELSLSIAPGLIYTGDEYALRQLVSILLDNAIKYALPGAPISLTQSKGRRGWCSPPPTGATPPRSWTPASCLTASIGPTPPAAAPAASASACPSPAASPRATTAPSPPSWRGTRSPSRPS